MKDRRLPENKAINTIMPLSESKAYEEHALNELRTAGYRITMPRIQVIRALADTTIALSAYTIHEKILAAGGRIDVVSVYRILTTLQEVGLIHHIGVVNGYFPCRAVNCHGRRTMVIVEDDGLNVKELPLSDEAMQEIEAAVSNAGYIPSNIKIEVNAVPKTNRK